jgi:hypothetical protein
VVALQQLQADAELPTTKKRVAVTYNPFFLDAQERLEERRRLDDKIGTGCVSAIYLQFGTDVRTAEACLEDLTRSYPPSQGNNLAVIPSLWLPTGHLLVPKKRYRRDIFLCDRYLSSPEHARQVVVDLLRIYQEYDRNGNTATTDSSSNGNNENDSSSSNKIVDGLLVQAPGPFKKMDLMLLESLLEERDAAG